MAVHLESPDMPLPLRVGREAFFNLVTTSSETIANVTWHFFDAGHRAVRPPGFDAKPESYDGVRIEANDAGVWLRPGGEPSYSELTIKGDVTLKTADGATHTETVEAIVTFSYTWGGMARAWYPYPANWEIPWDGDDSGRRAIVLIWDLISSLPDEIRATAGSLPIVRTSNAQGPRGAFRGAHVAFIHDAIHISDTLVRNLTVQGDLTDADVELCAVVLHEIIHAVTYRKALWNLHHELANIRRFLRSPTPPIIGALPAAAAAAPVVLLTLAKQLIAPSDFVSGYADATGWELASPLAGVARWALPVAKLDDLVHWLIRIPSQGMIQDSPIRPNVATGFRDVGAWFGLQLRGAADFAYFRDQHRVQIPQLEQDLAIKIQELRAAVDPADVAAKQQAAQAAHTALQQARAALQSAHEHGGFVSAYAAYDTLEDIAETVTYLTLDPQQRQRVGYVDVAPNNSALKQRRDYLVQEGVFPQTWNTPYTVGALYRGLEQEDHLDKWVVYL